MQKVAISSIGLQGMTNGVAEVQDAAQIRLFLVRRHYVSLNPRAIVNHSFKNCRIAREELLAIFFGDFEQLAIANHSGLDDFEQAGTKFPIGESREYFGIGN